MRKRKRVIDIRKHAHVKKRIMAYKNTHKYIIAIHTNAIDFAKTSIKYMFFANAGAITSVIFKLNISDYVLPITIFGLGTIYTILSCIYMHYRCVDSIRSFLNKNKNPILFWYKSLQYNILCCTFIYIPAVLFFAGVIFTILIFNDYF